MEKNLEKDADVEDGKKSNADGYNFGGKGVFSFKAILRSGNQMKPQKAEDVTY